MGAGEGAFSATEKARRKPGFLFSGTGLARADAVRAALKFFHNMP